MMQIAAPKTTRLERNIPSEAAYAQYDKHTDQYKPGESQPSLARDQETEH